MKHLDRFADIRCDPRRAEFAGAQPTSTFFRDLIQGGLVAQLLKPTEAKRPATALASRALEYSPVSALHLHFDAIESAGLAYGNGEVPWQQLKKFAATRVMEALHERWSPRHGTVFSEMTSSLEQAWQVADAETQEQIRSGYARFKPDLFEDHWNAKPRPDWDRVQIEREISATQVHRLLFSLSADTEFLVADRFEIWVLDLVSAGIAMHALAWSDQYQTHTVRVTPELLFWRAFDALFFSDEGLRDVDDTLIPVLELINPYWTDNTRLTLHKARGFYWQMLATLGLEPADIGRVVRRCWQVRPLVYRGEFHGA